MLAEIMSKLTPENHHIAVGLPISRRKSRLGHVKARHLVAAKADEAALLDQFRSANPALKAAGNRLAGCHDHERLDLPIHGARSETRLDRPGRGERGLLE